MLTVVEVLSMRAYLRVKWDSLRTSMWFVPTILILIIPLLGWLCIWVDYHTSHHIVAAPALLVDITPEGVQTLFSMLAGSLITAGAVIFSITIVVLTLITRQFGSYVLRTFRLKLYPKITIGVLIGTYLYAVLVVAVVSGENTTDWRPVLTMVVGIGLTVLTFLLFITLLHKLSNEIQAPQIVESVMGELRERVLALSLRSDEEDENSEENDLVSWKNQTLSTIDLGLKLSGYLQTIDSQGLLEFCVEENCHLRVLKHPGQFILTSYPVLELYGISEMTDEQKERLRECFTVGAMRAPLDDLEFNLNQLVEISLIALSPGMNHQFVALTCVNSIGEAIQLLMKRKCKSSMLQDEEGVTRVALDPFDFENFVDAGLNPLRQSVKEHPLLSSRLLELLKELVSLAPTKAHKDLLLQHVDVLFEEANAVTSSKLDKANLEQHYEAIAQLR